MNQKKPSIALLSDFDGTITKKDFFYMVIDELLKPEDIRPWQDYQDRKITHFEALCRIFSKIHLPIEEFHNFILQIPIEEAFIETAHYCKEQGINYFIVSAGADYYINYLLNHLKVKDLVRLYANKSFYTQLDGLVLNSPPVDYPFYSLKYGISKKACVEYIKKSNELCIFAGDGGPDIEPAGVADIVFARGRLLELCKESNIKAFEFNSYSEILEYLKHV